MKKDSYWIFVRDGEVRNVFKDRREAVRYFKELLHQTLKDFDNQDSHDEFDYPIKISEMEIKPVDKRESFLSLL